MTYDVKVMHPKKGVQVWTFVAGSRDEALEMARMQLRKFANWSIMEIKEGR